MKRIILLIAMLPLAACSLAAERASSTNGADTLDVRFVADYYWPQPVAVTSSDGQVYEIEPFPIVGALVVTRRDGAALSESDHALARNAVDAHCRGKGHDVPGPDTRFADGAWAFMPCPVGGQ